MLFSQSLIRPLPFLEGPAVGDHNGQRGTDNHALDLHPAFCTLKGRCLTAPHVQPADKPSLGVTGTIQYRTVGDRTALGCWPRPSFEKALVLVSFSQTLNRSISRSISFRASMRAFLSLISLDWIHVLIWSLYRCSFLISFFRSASNFSFWFKLSVSYTCKAQSAAKGERQQQQTCNFSISFFKSASSFSFWFRIESVSYTCKVQSAAKGERQQQQTGTKAGGPSVELGVVSQAAAKGG